MSVNLLIHNVGFLISILVGIVAIFFLLLNNPRAKGHIPLALCLIAVVIFVASHILGVNEFDPDLSRKILMFNLSIFFITIFNVHAILSLLKKDRKKWYMLALFYIVGIGFFIFFALNPELFLKISVPKMYFPNYYNPGDLNWVRIVWVYGIGVIYILYELIYSAIKTDDVFQKRQLKFFAIALFLGYAIGFIPNFLVYNISIDPLWGMAFVVVFVAIFIYAGVRYELMNIKVIAKQALTYSTVVASIGGTIVLFEYLNKTIGDYYPKFPALIIPTVSVALVIVITLIVWKKIREVDLLKYEFITTVTHKFRTPLTQIKWASENLENSAVLTADDRLQLEYIRSADSKLVELTNVLFNISDLQDSQYHYTLIKNNLAKTVDEVISSLGSVADSQKIQIKKSYISEVFVKFDEQRIKFVIQTFIENAIHYSPEGSIVDVSITKNEKSVIFSVKDSGIGILKTELPFIFLKFYRGHKARKSDTEGMGIGLFISKGILERHKGTIHVSSEGQGKGSTFSFILPLK
jgi:signal transduction histidine kinase